MKRRFIGPVPFSYDDRRMFFGRDKEIEYLSTLILNNKTTVIHGKSGTGKSSIINAGLIPALVSKYSCEIIRVRFYNNEKDKPRPVESFMRSMELQLIGRDKYLDQFIKLKKESAWHIFKTLQRNSYKPEQEIHQHTGADAGTDLPVYKPVIIPEKNYIVIFDQFEELFSYDVGDVKKFMRELQGVLCNIIPEEFSQFLRNMSGGTDPGRALGQELAILEKDIPVRVVFSIRADQFNYMTHLVPFIPDLLKNTYKIARLQPKQVEEAISEPPRFAGDYVSPAFSFDPLLVAEMIAFLSLRTDPNSAPKIEVFEMQIICQELEDILVKILDKKGRSYFGDNIIFKRSHLFESGDIKDRKRPFAEIIKNYYRETIGAIKGQAESLSARFLIEKRLIDLRTNKRISLDSALVTEMGIADTTISLLTSKSILRIETNSVSGVSYEISHDTLVHAILNAANEMGELDKTLHDYFHASLELKKRASRKLFLHLVYDNMVDGRSAIPENSVTDENILRRLTGSGVFIKSNPSPKAKEPEIPVYSIREAFRHSARKGKEQYEQTHKINLSSKFWITIFIAGLVIFALLISLSKISQVANRNFALYYLAYSIDTLKDKEAAVRLASYIRDRNKIYRDDIGLFNKKSLLLFQAPEIQAKEALHTDTLQVTSLKPDKTSFSADGKFKIVLLSETDSVNVPNSTTCELSSNDGRLIRKFQHINNAYFIKPGILLYAASSLPKTPGRSYSHPFEMSNQFYLFDCHKMEQTFSFPLTKDEILYPYQFDSPPVMENSEYSYRVKITAAGNLVVPVMKMNKAHAYVNMIKIIKPGRQSQDIPFDRFNNTSLDGKKIIVGGTVNGRALVRIISESGETTRTIPGADFANFTKRNSLLYNEGTVLVYEAAGNTNRYQPGRQKNMYQLPGKSKKFQTGKTIEYAWTDSTENFALVKNPDGITIYNLQGGDPRNINEPLAGFNLDKNIVLTKGNKNNLRVHYLNSNKIIDRSWPDTIQSVRYNFNTGQTLLLTGKNRMFLLGQDLRIMAGYQLTANDIIGFSAAGNIFYYVRDQYYSVFATRGNLVNYFDPEACFNWLKKTGKIKLIEEEEARKKYKLSFTPQPF